MIDVRRKLMKGWSFRSRLTACTAVMAGCLCGIFFVGGEVCVARTAPKLAPANFYSSFYPVDGVKSNGVWVQAISVTAPAGCSEIKGDTTVTFKAPGMTQVKANCWQQPTKGQPGVWGHDVDLAPNLKLDADGNGSFVFHADQFPNGPIIVRIYAKGDDNKQDYFELQLFNKGGVVWDQGAPKSAPPAAKGMKLAFCDDFTGPLSISSDDSGTYWTHWSGGDGSSWPFGENEGPHNPFSQVGTYLRIHASKPEGTNGTTGSLTPVHPHSSKPGITVKAPCYIECRFLAQNFPGAWPAFWVTTQSNDPKVGCDEMDLFEGYGTNSNGGIWTAYHATTHFWGKPEPAWDKEVGPDGNLVYPITRLIDPMTLGGKSAWSDTFHTYGLLVTKTYTVYYFDNIEVLRQPSGENSRTLPMTFIVNLALGSGWPIHLERYGNQSDMWVDYVRMYEGEPAPVAPRHISATPGNGEVILSWTQAVSATSYNIYRGDTAGGVKVIPIATGITGASHDGAPDLVVTYVDKNLTNGHKYFYRVATVNINGTSDKSSEVSANPKFGPPIAPEALKARGNNRQITLSWTGSPDASSYNIYRGNEAGREGVKPVAVGITTPFYTDKDLPDGVPLFYTVAAVSAGGISGHTNEASGIPAMDAETIAIAYSPAPPAMDGKADPVWKDAAVYPINRLGLGIPTTTNGVFQVMWDPDNLYYLFTVNDSSTVNGTPDFNGDAVEIYLDPKNTKTFGGSYTADDFRYTLGYGHTQISEYAHSNITNVTFAQSTYQGGYREEVKIPWTTLHVTPFVGMSIGLDAAIDDAVTLDGGRTSALFWHDNTANDYQRPELFGNGTLKSKVIIPPLVNGVYKVINVKSGMALDVPGASMVNVVLDQQTYDGGTNQRWTLTDLGGGSYSIANVKSASVVDCSPSFENNHQVVQWPISGSPSSTQRFTLTTIGDHYLLTNIFSGKVLDVMGASTAEGAHIVQTVCTGSDSQLWDITPIK